MISKRSFLTSLGLAVSGSVVLRATTDTVAAQSTFSWNSYHADAQNSGYNPETSSPVTEFNQEWRFETQNQVIESAPVLADGVLFIGSTDRSLYAINTETGSEKWSFDASAAIRESPAVTEDVVVVVNRDDAIFGVDRADGSEIWSRTETPYRYAPLLHDGIAYVTARNRVVGLDTQTGETLWESNEMNEIPTAGPAYSDGRVFVCAEFTTYAFDASSGDKIWSYDAGGDIEVVPTVHDGVVYVGSRNNRVYAIDAETGDELWDYDTGNRVLSSPAVRDQTVFVSSFGAENATHAIDATDGSRKWSFDYGTHRSNGPSLIVTDEVVYVSRTHELFAVDIDTGDEVDRLRLDDRIETTPCIVDGTVYFGSRDHSVYAYSGSSDREAEFEIGRFRLFSENVPTDLGDTEITIPTGAEVRFSFSVSNQGIGDGEFEAVVEINDTVIDERTISIPAGGSEEIRVERTFDDTGEYEVSLNGTVYGTVVVEEGDVEGQEDDTSEEDDEAVVNEEAPGFGIPAAAAGVGGAIAYIFYRRNSVDESHKE